MDQLLGVSVQYDAPVAGTGTVDISDSTSTITGVGTKFTTELMQGYAIIVAGKKYKVTSITDDTTFIADRIPGIILSGQDFTISNEAFYKCRPTRYSNLTSDETYYRFNQPKTDPFFIKYDTGIFIYPVPTVDVTMGLMLHGTYDLITQTTSDTPMIEDTWHYAIALGMKKFIFNRKGLLNEKNDAAVEYEREIKRVLSNISETYKSPVERESPTLTQFQ